MTEHNRDPVQVNSVNRTITVPHLGITLRVLIGAALNNWPSPVPGERREYDVLYKRAAIGTLRVKQHDDVNQPNQT